MTAPDPTYNLSAFVDRLVAETRLLPLAAGGSLYFAAGIATVIILVILAGLKPLEKAYRARVQSCVMRITAERGALAEA